MRNINFPTGSLYTNLTDVKNACSGGYQDALHEAKRECGRGTYVSRGRHFKALRNDELVAGEAECWPWDGTLKGLLEAINEARFHYQADVLAIEGGINYALNPRDYADCAYDPWVGEWAVTVWRKPGVDF
jgi:hypothetical protein